MMKMKEKMKKLEEVIEFYQSIIDSDYRDSELLEKRYALKEDGFSISIYIDYLEDKVTLYFHDSINGGLYEPFEFDTEQKLEEFIDIMSECPLCDISLRELKNVIYKKFTTKVKWSDAGDVNLTINHKPGTKPLTSEQIMAILLNRIESFAFQKDGDCICTKRVYVASTLNEYNRLIEHLDNEKKHWDEKGWIP